MKSVQISVIIPFYNAIKTAEKSLLSVIAELQSVYKKTSDYEIICVDDGSSDGTEKFLDTFKKNNDSIVVLHQKNSGAATARNAGLEIAKGALVAFNDSDDEWLSGSLLQRLSILDKDANVKCVTGNHCIEKQRIPKLQKLGSEENLFVVTLKNEMFKNYYTTQNSILRREVIDSGVKFKDGMRYSEEMLFFFQIVSKYKCVFCNEKFSESILGKERFGDFGLSGNLKLMEKGELESLKFAYKNYGVSFMLYLSAKLFSVMKYFRRVLITKIRNVKDKR